VLDDTSPSWWYEQDGQQAGPVTAAGIARLVAEGRLGPAHRVWRDGMGTWEPLSAVAELAPALQGPGMPPPRPPPPAAPPSGLEEISIPGVILLSLVTFGIYGIVKFHQTGKAYEALAGRSSHFSRDFWLFVGLGIAGFLLNAGGAVLGVPLAVASLVFQVLTLREALVLREQAIRRAAIRPEITGDGTHKALFVLGIVLSPLLVGLVLLAVQAVKWFSDWNAIGSALGRGPGGAAAAPAPGR
jgi:hypothetical protein